MSFQNALIDWLVRFKVTALATAVVGYLKRKALKLCHSPKMLHPGVFLRSIDLFATRQSGWVGFSIPLNSYSYAACPVGSIGCLFRLAPELLSLDQIFFRFRLLAFLFVGVGSSGVGAGKCRVQPNGFRIVGNRLVVLAFLL